MVRKASPVIGQKRLCLSVSYTVEFGFVFNYIVSLLKSFELDVKDVCENPTIHKT